MRISRGMYGAIAAAVALVVGATVAVVLPAAHRAGAAGAPAVVHNQVITVRAASATSQTATLEVWARQSNGVYRRVHGPITAWVGSAGVGKASEGSTKTPAGQWWLTQAFGINANPGTSIPYFRIDNLDWWNGDSSSAHYNQHRRCAPGSCDFKETDSEHLIAVGAPYAYAVVINYNTGPTVKGAGSAFFLHVTNNRPTAGCVAVTTPNLQWMMRWIKPQYHPLISIGVGNAAYAAIPKRTAG